MPPVPDKWSDLSPLRIAAIYLAVGGLWILLYDTLVHFISGGPGVVTFLQMIKGWGFVGVTGLLVFWLARRMESRIIERNAELLRSNRDLSRYAVVMAHHLKEPTRRIVTTAQLLSSRHGDALDRDEREHLDFLSREARRLHDLVRDLLKYSEISTKPPGYQLVNLDNLLRDTEIEFSAQIKDSGARLVFDHLPEIRCDRRQMSGLFRNLLDNAIKFRRQDARTEIAVTAERKGRFWHFRFSDNGIGLDPEHSAQLFGIFIRLHPPDVYEGTGIGLAMCKRIIEAHGGEIWLESKHGEGTTVHFTLPADPKNP